MFSKDYEKENRKRLRNILKKIKIPDDKFGWEKQIFAVGGLTDIGFSKIKTNLLIAISSSGRGIFDCNSLDKIERDYDDTYSWFNTNILEVLGFGMLENEVINTGGLYGGGLPTTNSLMDSLEVMALDWPYVHIIIQENGGDIYSYRGEDVEKCSLIAREGNLRTYGFSYCGNYIAIATSSDLAILKRKEIKKAHNN